MKIRIESIVDLLQIKGMGRRTAFKICKNLDFSPTSDEWFDVLSKFVGENPNVRMPLLNKSVITESFKRSEQILEKSENAGVKIFSFFDSQYPECLKSIADPPLIINIKGDINKLKTFDGIAIIGTREPNDAGLRAGVFFSKALAERGFNIVSGLAKGCDTAAHQGSLLVGGMTTAVLAHGLQTIYPKENKNLAENILNSGGILLSEYLFGSGALSNYFIERDRLQSGLSKATIVIQTAQKGGTMHAVRATLNSNKILATVKYGNQELGFEKTEGNEMLIRNGEAFPLSSTNLIEFINLFDSNKLSNSIEKDIDTNSKSSSQLKLEI
jgi:DNA processing protein